MSDLSQNILNKIKKEQIAPKPRWQFLLKEYLIWFLFSLSIFIGSISFSIILHFINGCEYLDLRFHKNIIFDLIYSLPIIWPVLLVIFWCVAFYNFKHSERGYKYRATLILALSILISLVFGTMLFLIGFGSRIDRILEKRLNFYTGVEEKREKIWSHPQRGYLGGTITEIKDNKTLSLVDFQSNTWTIHLKGNLKMEILEQIEDKKVVIKGSFINEKEFEADEIRPWEIKRRNIKIYIENSNLRKPKEIIIVDVIQA